MKRVAIVAPSFAPSSHPPAIRTRFLATHLAEFGWQPTVVTVKPEMLGEAHDPEFLALLPQDLHILRTKAMAQRVTRLIGLGDLGIRSFPYHLRALSHLCKIGRVDVVLIPGPPWYSFCLGPVTRFLHGVPYVLDYIDPWVQSLEANAQWPSKGWIAHRVAMMLEPAAVRGAAAVVCVSEGTGQTVRSRYPELPLDRFVAIPYGFEESDFGVFNPAPGWKWSPSYAGAFNVCHVGALSPTSTDTLRALFRAVARVRATHPAGPALRLHFLGTGYAAAAAARVTDIAKDEGVGDIVRERPVRMPYGDAIRAMRAADMLLALGGAQSHYLASKIFPSLLAGRPLLAVFHRDSGACRIASDAGARLVTFHEDDVATNHVEEIARTLTDLIDGAVLTPERDRIREVAARYSARAMAQELADVLDRASAPAGTPLSPRRAAA